MGMIELIKYLALTVAISTSLIQSALAKNVELERVDWPTQYECDQCLSLRYLSLRMQIPLDLIGEVEVMYSKAFLAILSPHPSNDSVVFVAIPPNKQLLTLMERSPLFDDINVENNEELFDLIGQLPDERESLRKLRQMKNLDTAYRYTKASKGNIHAYLIQNINPYTNQPHSELNIIIDEEKILYSIVGELSEDLYTAILSNLEVAP